MACPGRRGFSIKVRGLAGPGALGKMKRLGETFKRPFSGFATETFHSAAPLACGPYAARVRLLPASDQPKAGAASDWAGDFLGHFAGKPLQFRLQLQFFVDEARTPIEGASVDWPEDVAPYVTVGVLSIPPQDPQSAAGQELASAIEAAAFDPWCALMEHRPLGEVMRARKAVYFQSQQGRR